LLHQNNKNDKSSNICRKRKLKSIKK
jgi:hypothetical protein